MGRSSGGKGKTTLNAINSTHTTITSPAAITVADKVKTSITKDGLTLDTIQCDPETITFLEDNAAGSGSSDNAESVILETKVEAKTSESASGTQGFLAISYGADMVDGVDDVVEVVVQLGTLSEDAGDRDWEANKFTRAKFTLNKMAALDDISLASTLFDASILDTAAAGVYPLTFPEGKARKTFFLPKAA
jgi:hypothetical protein